jgi:hypothetical protein
VQTHRSAEFCDLKDFYGFCSSFLSEVFGKIFINLFWQIISTFMHKHIWIWSLIFVCNNHIWEYVYIYIYCFWQVECLECEKQRWDIYIYLFFSMLWSFLSSSYLVLWYLVFDEIFDIWSVKSKDEIFDAENLWRKDRFLMLSNALWFLGNEIFYVKWLLLFESVYGI